MTALISKPGLTSASALSIPTAWSQSWFRGFINSYLTGGDVRNAVGKNGIVVSGTLASPYATISLGGTGAITLTNDVTITPASGVGLTVNAASGSNAAIFNGAPNQYAVEIIGSNTSGGSDGLYIEAGTNGSDAALRIDTYAIADTFVIYGNSEIYAQGFMNLSATGANVGITVNQNNSAPAFEAADGTGGGFYNATTGANGLIMNSAGADYGTVGNYGTQLWALGYSSTIGGPGTPVIAWGVGTVGFHGVTPVAATTGFGTPTNLSLTTNFPGTAATLAQCGGMLSELITIFKNLGLLGA
jgi:hypothetical protein